MGAVEVGVQRLDERRALVGGKGQQGIGVLLPHPEDLAAVEAVGPQDGAHLVGKRVVEAPGADPHHRLVGRGDVDRLTGRHTVDPLPEVVGQRRCGADRVDEVGHGPRSRDHLAVQRQVPVRLGEEPEVDVVRRRHSAEDASLDRVGHAHHLSPVRAEPLARDRAEAASDIEMLAIGEALTGEREEEPVVEQAAQGNPCGIGEVSREIEVGDLRREPAREIVCAHRLDDTPRAATTNEEAAVDPTETVREYLRRMREADPTVGELFAADAELIGLGQPRVVGRRAIDAFYADAQQRARATPTLVSLAADGSRVFAELHIALADGTVVHVVDVFLVGAAGIESLTYFVADDPDR